MKRNYKRLIVIPILSIVVLIASCKKFVEIAPPTTELVTSSVFNNNATATSAQLAIYTQMYSKAESYSLAEETGLLGDELTNYSSGKTLVPFYTNAMTATSGPGPWSDAYNYIYQANAIIAALQNNNALTPSVSRQLLGESLFIRAFWFFYLSNLYGDVPLVTTTNYENNATIARTSQAQVYQQIITDLKSAQNLLNSNYVDESDTTITTQRVRPTTWAATALLARAYLYTGDYSDAVTQATAIISNSAFYSLNALDSVFLANSKETIWQLYTPLPTNFNTIDGSFFILLSAPTTTAISPQLLNSFEIGDNRRTNWIDSVITGSNTYYFPFKYKVRNSPIVTEFTMVLRLGEQYLIRAEAYAQQNKLQNAAADLNIIRNRAGLSNISDTTAASQNALLTAILHERQVELFTEWGNRWFDLIRTGNINLVMGAPGNVCQFKGGNWTSTDSLYPIPQSERSLDPNLTQNDGY